MSTETALHILVIILSTTLFIALVISIVVGVFVVKLVKALRQITEKGEQLVDTAEETVTNIRQNVGAVGVIHSLTQLVKMINKVKKGK